jgi:hypothetical protein
VQQGDGTAREVLDNVRSDVSPPEEEPERKIREIRDVEEKTRSATRRCSEHDLTASRNLR